MNEARKINWSRLWALPRLRLLFVVLVCAMVGPAMAFAPEALAVGAPDPENREPGDLKAAGRDDYLAAASRLTLRFRGYPELTGDYRVNPDNVISVPVIGRVSIVGLTLAELEKTLSVRLSRIVQKEAFVTAEIAAYFPVYVTGAVRNPGAVEWRPGLNVLQAIALVGGMAMEVTPGVSPLNGANPLDLEKAIDDQKRDVAVIARLRAERAALSEVSTPQALVGLVGANEAKTLIAAQNVILQNQRAAETSKRQILQEGIDAGSTEINSLREQMRQLNKQLEMRQGYREKVQDLLKKGITTAERDMEEGIKITDLEEKISNVRVGLAKSASSVAELRLAVDGLQHDRIGVIDAELDRLERHSAQLGLQISAYRQLPLNVPVTKAEDAKTELKSPLSIVRQANGASQTIPADQGTLMQPGDVLIVARF